jgi:hypothetical protein
MYTPIIASLLALAPPGPTDIAPPTFDVADVEVERSTGSANFRTFDAEGEVSAEIVVWLDPTGRPRLDANFSDGLHMSVVVDGESSTVDSDNSTEVSVRVQAINDWLAENEPQANWREWGACGLSVAIAVVECGGGGPLGCGIGGVLMACECLPLFTDVECV